MKTWEIDPATLEQMPAFADYAKTLPLLLCSKCGAECRAWAWRIEPTICTVCEVTGGPPKTRTQT